MDDINLQSPREIKALLQRHGLAPNKQLGQNFLLDGNILARIAEAGLALDEEKEAEGQENCVLEIGPGLGSLTQELARRADRVLAVELDRGFIGVLEETLRPWGTPQRGTPQRDMPQEDGKRELTVWEEDALEGALWPEGATACLVHGDFLKQDLNQLHALLGGTSFSVCANLPYYITTPIIMKLLESGLPIDNMVFLMQREVADRMASPPGSKHYGSLSIAVQHYAALEVVAKVPPGCFWPQPKVESIALKLRLRAPDYADMLDDSAAFFKLVRAAFAMRRKTLANNLKAAWPEKADRLPAALAHCGIAESARAEQLSPRDFVCLAAALEI